MKRAILFLTLLMLVGSLAFSQTITLLSTDTKMMIPFDESKRSFFSDYALPKLLKDYPKAKVELLQVDMTTGSTMTIDALLASGQAPNIYCDTLVRASKLMQEEYALPLEGNVRDVNKFNPGVLDAYKRNGKTLASPIPGAPQGICLNMDVMKTIGYIVPNKWTINDFLTMAEKVKQKYGDKVFATGMFAANQSGDYLINNWFASFGAKYYNPGDYSHTTIKETGGAKAYEFFQTLVKNGYVPPGAAMLNDDDYAADWGMGKYAATAFFVGWQNPYWDTAIQQKKIDKPFEVKYVPFPRGPGVDNVPTYMMNGVYVIHKTGAEKDKVAARLVEYLNDGQVQSWISKGNTIPNRSDAKALGDNEQMRQIGDIVKAGGFFDVGLTYYKFTATRATHYPILQKVLNLTITPEVAIAEYEAALNTVLKD